MLTRFLTTIALMCFICLATAGAQVASTTQQSELQKTQIVSPEKQALIKELLAVLDARKNANGVLKAMFAQFDQERIEMVWKTLSEMKELKALTPDEQQRLRIELTESTLKASQRLQELFTQRIDFAQLTEDISTELYAKYFNENEIRDLIVFHSSATGRKSMDLMPNLITETMKMTAERISPVITEVVREIAADDTTKFKEQVITLAKSHHRTTASPAKPRRRP